MPKIPENDRDSTEVLLDILRALKNSDSSFPQDEMKPSLQHLKELRKMLAELQLELRKLSKIEAWTRSKLLNCALLQAKLKRLEVADVFVDLEDIKRLAEIRSDVDDWLANALRNSEINENPLAGMLMDARDLHSTILKIRHEYDQILEALIDLGGTDWSHEYIQKQKAENQALWESFQKKLKSEKERLSKHFPQSKHGPEPELYALDQLMDPESLWNEDEFKETLALTRMEGELWEKAVKQYRDYQNRIEALEKEFQEDEKQVLEAHLLAQKGDYQQAGKILEQTSLKFVDLPYESVQDELYRWKELAVQPFQELADLFPSAMDLDQSREAVLAFGTQFPALLKDLVNERLRGSFNPLGLFLSCRKWEKQVTSFIDKCNKAQEKVSAEPASDFRTVISERWNIAHQNAQLLLDEIRKRASGYFFRKTIVLALLGATIFLGYQLIYYWHKLPDTGIRFNDSGAFINSAKVVNKRGDTLKHWLGKDAAYGEFLGLPPDRYTLEVEFKDTFPMKLDVHVDLGKTTDLSDRLKLEYSASLSRVLEFKIPSGSEITLTHAHLDQERKYRVEAETLPFGIHACTWLDWDAVTNRMAIAERTGRLLLVSTEDNVATLGSLYVQGESFEKVILSKGPGKKYVAGISMSGVVYVWEAESGKVLGQLSHEGKSVVTMAFDYEARSILTLDSDYHLRLWELSTAQELNATTLTQLASPEEKTWALRHIHPAWQLSLPRGLKQSLDNKVQAAEIIVPQNTQNIVVGILQTNGNIQLWTGKSLQNLRKMDTGMHSVQAFTIHPSGNSMMAVNLDGELQQLQWNEEDKLSRSRMKTKLRQKESIRLLFDPKGEVLLAVAASGAVESIQLADDKGSRQLPFVVTTQAAIACAPNADSIAFFSAKEEIQIWEKWITQLIFAPKGDYSLTIHSPEGKSIFEDELSTDKGGIYRFDLHKGGQIGRLARSNRVGSQPIHHTSSGSNTGGILKESTTPAITSISATSGTSITDE